MWKNISNECDLVNQSFSIDTVLSIRWEPSVFTHFNPFSYSGSTKSTTEQNNLFIGGPISNHISVILVSLWHFNERVIVVWKTIFSCGFFSTSNICRNALDGIRERKHLPMLSRCIYESTFNLVLFRIHFWVKTSSL